jgi:predicted TIM-barrel fold metal-dependent hydrolase
MPERPLIDTHTHVVSPDHGKYPLNPRSLSGQWYLEGPASADELSEAMTLAGIERAILVQGVGAYTYDNRYAADAAEATPGRFVSACCIDVEAPNAVETLTYWVEARHMAGIRLFALARQGSSWLIDDGIDPIWKRAEELAAHVIVTILPHQLSELEHALSRFPNTPISLDHCGFATAEAEARSELFKLARHPNLHLKISTHNLDDAIRTEGSARPLIHSLVQEFGADRLMWGSDFCQTHDRPYAALAALARDAFADLQPDEQTACFSGTARKLWPGLST